MSRPDDVLGEIGALLERIAISTAELGTAVERNRARHDGELAELRDEIVELDRRINARLTELEARVN